jgi:hypothetical protein
MATVNEVQKLYVAYFNRPADFFGLEYWKGQTVAMAADAFSASQEYKDTYAGMSTGQVIDAIYQNLFGHGADVAGLSYWATQINSGKVTMGQAVLAIANGALGTDKAAFDAKVSAATKFTSALDTAAEALGYSGEAANDRAKDWLTGITSAATEAAATAPTALASGVNFVIAVGGQSGKTYTLTEDPEVLSLTGGLADKVFGVIDGADSTLNNGDVIEGNGHTILRLAVDDVADDVPNADVTGVSVVEFVGGTSGWITFDNGWDIDTLRVVNSTSGFDVEHDNQAYGLDIEIVDGDDNWIWGTFTNEWYLSMGATGDLSFVNGAITGVADVSGDLYVSFAAQSDDAGSIALGNVSLTALENDGSDVDFFIFQTQDEGGDITVGNVTIAGFDDAYITFENYGHTSDDTGVHSITVGNISLDVRKNDYLYMEIDNTAGSQYEMGDLTVGAVTVAVGQNATADLYFNNGWGGNTSSLTVGDVNIGNMTFNVAASGDLDFYLSAGATTGDTVVQGDLTIGNVALNVGNSGYAEFTVFRSVDADEAAAIGALTVGDVSINVGINATVYFSISDTISVTSVDADDFSMGLFKMGNLSAIVDDGGELYFDVDVSYEGSSTEMKEFGSFQFGNVSIQAGADAIASYTFDAEIEGDVASITRGDVTLVGGKDAYVWFSESFYAYTTDAEIGSYKAGNISLTAGEEATVSYSLEFSASTDNALGSVSIGNVSVVANGKNGYAEYSISADSSHYSEMGNFTIGNVTVNAAAEGADAYFYQWVDADDVVDGATMGNVSVTANGKNAYASFSVSVSADTVGDVTLGNITMAAIGENADAFFSYEVTATEESGTLTVGNIALSVTGTAKKTGTSVDLNLSNSSSGDGGDVIVGNITLSSTSVRVSGVDSTMTYDADVYIYGAGDVTVGNITVIGGDVDSEANDWGTLSNWLDLSAGGDVTVGNVDYSGYTGKSSVTNEIDLSGFLGAPVIKGSARKDNIYDTEDTNQIWGGASADKFVFTTDNSGKTLTSMDKIMDFSLSGGDTLDVGTSGTSAEYMEGTFASFSAFVSAINDADKDIYVGNVTGAGGLVIAVDHDGDDAVDFMVQLVGVTSLSNIDMGAFV